MKDRIMQCLFEPLGYGQPDGISLLAGGLVNTILITFGAVLLGSVLGVMLAVLRSSEHKICRWPALVYIETVRGTPVLVQLFIINFVVFASVNVDKWAVAVIAFGINSGAYVSEIVRASQRRRRRANAGGFVARADKSSGVAAYHTASGV